MTKDLLVVSVIATIVEDPDTIPMSVRHPTKEEKILQKEEVEEVQWFDLEEVYEQCGKRREIFCVPEGGLGVVRSYLKSIEKN